MKIAGRKPKTIGTARKTDTLAARASARATRVSSYSTMAFLRASEMGTPTCCDWEMTRKNSRSSLFLITPIASLNVAPARSLKLIIRSSSAIR